MDYLKEIGIKRLNEINSVDDLKDLSCAISLGGHCSLFEVNFGIKSVQDIKLIVIGTKECTNFAKRSSMARLSNNDKTAEVISAVLEEEDLVFGFGEQLRDLIIQLDKEDNPRLILLVTTCAVEIIGEDIESVIYQVRDEVNAKVQLIKTEHFKTKDYYTGISSGFKVMTELMVDKPKKEKSFNIIGVRYPGIANAEVVKLLKNKGYEINSIFPYNANIESIEKIPYAQFNIVTDYTGLEMAEELKEKFNIPYCFFDQKANLDSIDECYNSLEKIINESFEEERNKLKEEVSILKERASELVIGESFVYGHATVMPFEFVRFLSELGMIPKLVLTRNIYETDWPNAEKMINQGIIPFVSKNACLKDLNRVFKDIMPDIYVGSEDMSSLKRFGIKNLRIQNAPVKIGYELPMLILETIIKNFEEMI